MNQVIPFNFENHDVRVVMIDGQEWWVGKDVVESLGFKDTVNAIKQHCKGVVKHHPLQTGGGKQEVRIISEGDVFRLIVNSRLPQAQRFEKWLFEEVLPQIRKTGSYIPEDAKQDIQDLQQRVLELELNRTVTEKILLRSQQTIRRYQEQRLMTYADKREILNLRINKYRISDIQRITKKSRGAIKR
ncbi:MAG: Bro-N domain-containing protein, partial [Treponema sp.]|nr:Bro-N domain-containing protein [Treponema sp.]